MQTAHPFQKSLTKSREFMLRKYGIKTKTEECDYCDGTGIGEGERACSRCRGRGVVTVEAGQE